ncbi:MBL fold metallo-hydrolase [Marinicella sp. W31]|uniref:MBL fold metallo-hydrolase n=1 Tax=Marinicella sp. W31 TaxID=3023713 RepID=UPI0037565EAD
MKSKFLTIILFFFLHSFSVNSEEKTQSIKINEYIYVLVGGGANSVLVIDKSSNLLLDSKVSGINPIFMQEIKKISDQPIRFLINTHWHHDHTEGNQKFAQSDISIISHENTRNRLKEGQRIILPMTGGYAPALDKSAWPMISISDGMEFHLDKDKVNLIHVPNAHTDGDLMVHFTNADVIHMGDLFFSNGYPNIDVGSNGTIDGMIKAQKLALKLISKNGVVIPGHGNISSPEDLVQSINMLELVRNRIADLINKGISKDEIIKKKPLTDLDKKWGNGYIKQERMIIQAYKSLTPRSTWID